MNRFIEQIKFFLDGLVFHYNTFWYNFSNNPDFVQYGSFPFELFGNILIKSFGIIFLISLIFRNRKKRYFVATTLLSGVISVLSVSAIALIHKNGVQLELIDKTYGLLISSMGLSFYAFVYSVIGLCKSNSSPYNTEKAVLPILFYLFTLGFFYTYAKYMYAMQSIDVVKSIALIFISPLWLLYAPYSIIFCILYIFVLPLILVVKKDKQLVQKNKGDF